MIGQVCHESAINSMSPCQFCHDNRYENWDYYCYMNQIAYIIASPGIVDGSASKPALRQDTGYMVEKTYPDRAPYLGAFGAYLVPQ